MEVHICIVKAKSQAGNIEVKDVMTTQKGQSEKKRDLKFYGFCWKIQQRALGPGGSAAGVRYLWEYTRKVATSCPLKVVATLLSDSYKGVVGA